jgi:hypothetical protein
MEEASWSAELPAQGGYTLTVTENPRIHSDGNVEWRPTYYEIRNSAQGLLVADARWEQDRGWRTMDPHDRWIDVDEGMLRELGVRPRPHRTSPGPLLEGKSPCGKQYRSPPQATLCVVKRCVTALLDGCTKPLVPFGCDRRQPISSGTLRILGQTNASHFDSRPGMRE